MGFNLAALIAGITPDANPTTIATVTDNITGQIENGTAVSCEPNTLNVNWYNGNSQLTVGSESQTCVYGDSITVPTINATKPGYHFNWWKIKQ